MKVYAFLNQEKITVLSCEDVQTPKKRLKIIY